METIQEEEGGGARASDVGASGDALDGLAMQQLPQSPLSAAVVGGLQGAASGFDPLQTLTSGLKREVRDGAIQAHVCVVAHGQDVQHVMGAVRRAEAFRNVVSWSYAYRIMDSATSRLREASDDGLDEGCGEKLLSVLRRFALQGLLLVISRWQDFGATPGLELLGTPLYSVVVERCKDLITSLKEAMGLGANAVGSMEACGAARPGALPQITGGSPSAPSRPQIYDFSHLPELPQPRAPTKYGPNHFLSDSSLNRQGSCAGMPNLFSGGDVRLWMANDQSLRGLPDTELWQLRSMRQPDWRVEEVLQAVAALRGQPIRASASAAARWGLCKEMLKSPTLRTELLLFDANQVPLDMARHAMHLLEGLDAEDIRRASPGAAALFEWAVGVARWRLEGPPPSPDVFGRAPPAVGGASPAAAAALLLRLPSPGKVAPSEHGAHSLQKVRSAPQLKPSQPRCGGFSAGYAPTSGLRSNRRVGRQVDLMSSR